MADILNQYQQLIQIFQNLTHAATNSVISSLHAINSIFAPLSCNSFAHLIVDNGATITSSLSHFTQLHSIKPFLIRLPNGYQISAHIAGSVSLSPFIILDNVYYIPEFKFSLIYVTKMINYLQCSFTFYSNVCLIVQNLNKKLIGTI